jgi:hypothetical protein
VVGWRVGCAAGVVSGFRAAECEAVVEPPCSRKRREFRVSGVDDADVEVGNGFVSGSVGFAEGIVGRYFEPTAWFCKREGESD